MPNFLYKAQFLYKYHFRFNNLPNAKYRKRKRKSKRKITYKKNATAVTDVNDAQRRVKVIDSSGL